MARTDYYAVLGVTREASGARYGLFLTFKEGVSALTDALAARLPSGTLLLGTEARALRRVRKTPSLKPNMQAGHIPALFTS